MTHPLFWRSESGSRGGHLSRTPKGFSLIEVLTVITLVAILSALLIPAFQSMSTSYSITRNGQMINDQFVLARQVAVSRNRDVELRLISKVNSGGQTNWATQLMQLDVEGGDPQPIGRKLAFADFVIINPDLSPILSSLPSETKEGETSRILRFRPNGRLAIQLGNTNNYLTIQHRRDDLERPGNYYTLQINPLTGRVSTYRP